MKYNRPPVYQAVIQRLPFKKEAAVRALGLLLFGRRIKAVVNQSTVRLDLLESIQKSMFLGSYEPTQTAWFKQCLRPGDVFIDVGASFGWYTTLGALLVGPTGKVFAFEPSPIASQVVEEMIKDSMHQNVLLTKAAVGRETGNVSLFLPTTRHLHSPSILQSDPDFVPVSVPVVALDHFAPLENVPKIKLVKIDVEGYEPDVLAGMERLIKEKRIENIMCEFNSGWLKRNSITPKQLYERFLGLGYQVHMQTRLLENVNRNDGEHWSLQDFWFSLPLKKVINL
ncbi:FkbM family methyltransferase [Patescibacteria group bacterium]|nr:FkbM family methyltransferase [Patescibacteria group bacterium]